MRRISAILTVCVLGFTTSVKAEDVKSKTAIDQECLVKASAWENAMIETSKVAEKRASSEKVRDLATFLVKEHKMCYEKLAEAAKNQKIAVVSGLEKDHQANLDRLNKLEGQDFDREYVNWVIREHKGAISMLETQVKDGKNVDTTALSKEVLPKMQEHLKKAEELAKNQNFNVNPAKPDSTKPEPSK